MHKSLTAFVFVLIAATPFCQSVFESYPRSFFASNDSFRVKWDGSGRSYDRVIGEYDTSNYNNNCYSIMRGELVPEGVSVYAGKDSVKFIYSNKPYGEYHFVTINSPKGKAVVRVGFEGASAIYQPGYVSQQTGNVQMEIPEVYELANIIWLLSPSGQRATDIIKEGEYYQKVMSYFKPFRNEPVLKNLDFPDSAVTGKYYEFRENSVCYSFDRQNKIVNSGPYYFITGEDREDFTNQFKLLLPLVENFATKSGFRKFYKENLPYYAKQIDRQRELLPVKNMWTWLEAQFPKSRYDAYKVIFSPLIKGSHSTQNFSQLVDDRLFRECVMFICGPDRYDQNKDLAEKAKEGLMSGIVFTEIDHNYVNPASNKYREAIDSIFSDRAVWATPGANFYTGSISVFNEYFTHAAFCAWVNDQYEKDIAGLVITEREKIMTERRGFVNFKAFNGMLQDVRERNKRKTLNDLYPDILEWCKTQVR